MAKKWGLGLAPVYCMVLHSNVPTCELALEVCLDLPLVWSIMSDIIQLRYVRWEEKKSNRAKRNFLYFSENLISFSPAVFFRFFKTSVRKRFVNLLYVYLFLCLFECLCTDLGLYRFCQTVSETGSVSSPGDCRYSESCLPDNFCIYERRLKWDSYNMQL
jgi:hypothetical protein